MKVRDLSDLLADEPDDQDVTIVLDPTSDRAAPGSTLYIDDVGWHDDELVIYATTNSGL